MALCIALGVNVWIMAVALPFGLMWRNAGGGEPIVLGGFAVTAVLAASSLLALALGSVRRSTALLMVVFPLLALLPQALAVEPAATRYAPPSAFVLLAASLLGYLTAVARMLGRAERTSAPPPVTVRPLNQDPTPSRWRRRLRVYRMFTVTAAAYPAVLIAWLNLAPSVRADLASGFGAQAARAQALGTVGVGLLWVILFRSYLLAPLEAHLQHDRDVISAMEIDRRHARRGRPRAGFYFAVAVALAAMSAVVWQRSR
jgi:hypothetical protein